MFSCSLASSLMREASHGGSNTSSTAQDFRPGISMTAYSDLAGHFGRIAALSNAVGILQWDSDVMMPKGAAETRAESMALLHVLRHGMVTDPRIGDWLAGAEANQSLGAWEKANLREIRRIWTVDTALPAELVEAGRVVAAFHLPRPAQPRRLPPAPAAPVRLGLALFANPAGAGRPAQASAITSPPFLAQQKHFSGLESSRSTQHLFASSPEPLRQTPGLSTTPNGKPVAGIVPLRQLFAPAAV